MKDEKPDDSARQRVREHDAMPRCPECKASVEQWQGSTYRCEGPDKHMLQYRDGVLILRDRSRGDRYER